MPQKERRSGVAADAEKAPQSVKLFRQTATSHPSALNAPSPTLTKNFDYEAPKITFFNSLQFLPKCDALWIAAKLFAEKRPHGACGIQRADGANDPVFPCKNECFLYAALDVVKGGYGFSEAR